MMLCDFSTQLCERFSSGNIAGDSCRWMLACLYATSIFSVTSEETHHRHETPSRC